MKSNGPSCPTDRRTRRTRCAARRRRRSALRARHVERRPRDVGGHHVHVRPLGGHAHRDAARAGADVGHAPRQRRRVDRQQVEQLLDDQLGFRPRNQHVRRDLEIAAPELLLAADVGGRLAPGPALDQRAERLFEAGRGGSSCRAASPRATSRARGARAGWCRARPRCCPRRRRQTGPRGPGGRWRSVIISARASALPRAVSPRCSRSSTPQSARRGCRRGRFAAGAS